MYVILSMNTKFELKSRNELSYQIAFYMSEISKKYKLCTFKYFNMIKVEGFGEEVLSVATICAIFAVIILYYLFKNW